MPQLLCYVILDHPTLNSMASFIGPKVFKNFTFILLFFLDPFDMVLELHSKICLLAWNHILVTNWIWPNPKSGISTLNCLQLNFHCWYFMKYFCQLGWYSLICMQILYLYLAINIWVGEISFYLIRTSKNNTSSNIIHLIYLKTFK